MKTKSLVLGGVALFSVGCSGTEAVSPDWRASAGVLEYTASTRVVPDPAYRIPVLSVEVTVSVTNQQSRSIAFNYGRCPGIVWHVFRTSDLSGDPVWSSASTGLTCSTIGYGLTTLAPGQTVQLVIYGPVNNILDSGLPSGTYYFDAVLEIGGGAIRPSHVKVPAGSLQLSR